mgnify:FL=1
MKKILTTFSVVLVLVATVFVAQPAFAAPTCGDQFPDSSQCTERVKCQVANGERHFITNPACACEGKCQLSDFVGLAVEVAKFIFGIAGSLALVMIIVGGFQWVTSGGSSDGIEKGKKTLTAAVVGLLIIFGAWVFVNTILATLTGNFKDGPRAVLTGEWWKVKS